VTSREVKLLKKLKLQDSLETQIQRPLIVLLLNSSTERRKKKKPRQVLVVAGETLVAKRQRRKSQRRLRVDGDLRRNLKASPPNLLADGDQLASLVAPTPPQLVPVAVVVGEVLNNLVINNMIGDISSICSIMTEKQIHIVR